MIAHYIDKISYLMGQYQLLILPVGILFSLAQCFFGFRYLKSWVALLGFCVGLGGGYIVSERILEGSTYAPVMIGVLAGIILLLLSFMLFKAGVFVLCAVVTAEMLWNLPVFGKIEDLNLPGSVGTKITALLPIFIILVVAVAIGFIAMKSTRKIVIAVTGITGAYRAISYLTTLLNVDLLGNAETRYVWMGVITLLAILGIVVQLFTTKE